jgi:hypothetical protein
MIYDLRSYATVPGRTAEYIELHATHAFPIMTRHLGEQVGSWLTASGEINRYVHMWRFKDMSDYEQRYAALFGDPAFVEYRTKIMGARGLLSEQQTTLLRPTSFSLLK